MSLRVKLPCEKCGAEFYTGGWRKNAKQSYETIEGIGERLILLATQALETYCDDCIISDAQ